MYVFPDFVSIYAEISEGARQPILLPKCSRYTELTIDMYHRKALHTGIAQTLSLVRQKFSYRM